MPECEDGLIIPPGDFGLVSAYGFQPYSLGGEHAEQVSGRIEA
jgi:hypothetical protein